MPIPSYAWAYTKPFYSVFIGTTTAVSLFSNALLLFIIYNNSSEHIGSYRYLLGFFALCDITATVGHATVQPIVHITEVDLYFIPRNAATQILGVSLGSVTCVLFIATYFQTFLVLSYHFIYRYKTVTSGLASSFTASWTFSKWFIAAAFVNLFYFTVFASCDPDPNTNTTHINTKATACLGICVLLFVSTAAVIIFCIYKTTAAIKSVNPLMTSITKRMHRQLFRALLIQTAVPCIFSYAPLAVLILSGTVSGISIGAFGNVLFLITAIFPSIDAFFVMFFISKFRVAVIRLFHLPFSTAIGSSVDQRRSR